jgi:subtilisin family serine protease
MAAALASFLAACGLSSAPGSRAQAGPRLQEAFAQAPTAPVVVMFRGSGSVAQTRAAVLSSLSAADFQLAHAWETVPGMAGRVTAAGLEALLSHPAVASVHVDEPVRAHMAEAVGMTFTNELHGMGFSGGGVTVAVLDTGTDAGHPDFAGRIVDEACFCTNAAGAGCCPGGVPTAIGPGSAPDDHGHGTNVAGVVLGGGVVAPAGMAPSATLVSIKVLDASGGGSSSGIVAGLDYVLSKRPEVRVVNLSLGLANLFPAFCDGAADFTPAFASVINGLRARGALTFASSGNSANPTSITVPACIAQAVAVGAVYDGNVGTVTFGCSDPVTQADQVTCFSNASVALDLLAPGAAITAAGVGGGLSTFMGTSQASPAAAGAAAALLSANPAATADQIELALKTTGVGIIDSRNGLGFPRINVRAALDLVR